MSFLFALTLFTGAALLFVVQPMIAKMVLPLLGGSPAVWSTCMVFFQSALLAGYAYAHATAARLGVRRQALLHVAVLGLPWLALPFFVEPDFAPTSGRPTVWLLRVLLTTSGLPFFVVAATAPMLQGWFAATGRPSSRDPYFLYAASNLGSLLALLSYPLAIEPSLPLASQGRLWAYGYGLLSVLILACAAAVRRPTPRASELTPPNPPIARGGTGNPLAPRPVSPPCKGGAGGGEFAPDRANATRATTAVDDADGDPPDFRRRLGWVALAFVPSSMMLGVTAYLSADVAPVPLLWVVPLALYLLSFAIVYARRPPLPHSWAVRALPPLAVPLTAVLAVGLVQPIWIPLHLLTFFSAALVCHGELARRRPSARHLTSYYLALAIGGVLGGAFNALAAPMLFDRLAEYPLALVLACLALPRGATNRRRPPKVWLTCALPAVVLVLTAGLVRNVGRLAETSVGVIATSFAAGLSIYAFSTFKTLPLRFTVTLGAVLLACGLGEGVDGRVLLRERNFFGVLRVTEVVKDSTRFHRFFHGNTLHGQQNFDPAGRHEPLAYFTRTGPIGQVFEALDARGGSSGVAVIGLGAGTLATYAESGRRWTFYEIDPAVARIARDPQFFTFLNDSPAKSLEIVLGDARLRLREAADHGYGLIVFDAFSSDAVPVHLLTREAVRLYRRKLAPGGLIVCNISNRYLDLDPVVGTLALDAGLICRVRYDVKVSRSEKKGGKQPSIWAALAETETDLGILARDPRWRPARSDRVETVWRDDFSNIAGHFVVRRRAMEPMPNLSADDAD